LTPSAVNDRDAAPSRKKRRRVKLFLSVFPSFNELYKVLPLEQCGYLPEELAGASAADMEIYYSPTQQRQYGVVGIEIALI
jgi:ASC-1-like (ASCH) protein